MSNAHVKKLIEYRNEMLDESVDGDNASQRAIAYGKAAGIAIALDTLAPGWSDDHDDASLLKKLKRIVKWFAENERAIKKHSNEPSIRKVAKGAYEQCVCMLSGKPPAKLTKDVRFARDFGEYTVYGEDDERPLSNHVRRELDHIDSWFYQNEAYDGIRCIKGFDKMHGIASKAFDEAIRFDNAQKRK